MGGNTHLLVAVMRSNASKKFKHETNIFLSEFLMQVYFFVNNTAIGKKPGTFCKWTPFYSAPLLYHVERGREDVHHVCIIGGSNEDPIKMSEW